VFKDEIFSVKYLVNEKLLRHENIQEYYKSKIKVKQCHYRPAGLAQRVPGG
jgi:hypothetical protein